MTVKGLGIDAVVVTLAIFACLRYSFPLLEPEETRYAELPRQMLESGSWIVPTFDGQPYLDKPPLLYWLVAATFKMFGVSVFVSRIIPTLAAALTIWIVYRWCRSVAGTAVGLVSAVILTVMPDFLYRAPMLTMNGLLALATTAAMAAGYTAIARERVDWKWWIVSAAICATGVMTKGPIALALVVGPLFLVPWVDGRLRKPNLLHWAVFGGTMLAIAAPWFAVVESREPSFISYFFWKHNIERVVDPFDHVKPWWYYLPQILLGTLPWTLLLVAAAWAWLRRQSVSPLLPFGLIAGVIGLVLFSISGSKRPVYLVPIYPPLAVAAGAYLCGELNARGRFWGLSQTAWHRSIAVISVIIIAASFAFLPRYHQHFSCTPVLDVLDKTDEVYAVPYSSPAVSFAWRKVVPAVPLERLDEIAHPVPGQSRTIIVPVRFAKSVREKLGKVDWTEVENSEIVAFSHHPHR